MLIFNYSGVLVMLNTIILPADVKCTNFSMCRTNTSKISS